MLRGTGSGMTLHGVITVLIFEIIFSNTFFLLAEGIAIIIEDIIAHDTLRHVTIINFNKLSFCKR